VTCVLVADLPGKEADGSIELAATIRIGDAGQDVWFRVDGPPVTGSANPFFAVALIPAMRRGFPLRIEGRISPRVLRGADRVQQTMSVWNEDLHIVDVQAREVVSAKRKSDAAVGAFFSGGVDSFYTIQKHRDQITHLIFVHGFDIPLEDAAFREHVAAALRRAAQELRLEFVEIETNVRRFAAPYASWGRDYHGSAMAAVALLLAPRFRKIYIPGSYSYAFLFPYGSHPGLDPLWSSESLELMHDGCEATRFEKVEALASWETALQTLRVCWQLKDGLYNCCECRKCLWTMAFLRACGALERAVTFDRPLDLAALRRSPPEQQDERARFVQALAAIERRGGDPELSEALRSALGARDRWATPVDFGRVLAGARRLLAWPGRS
jgi:hypothetical protein